MAAEYTCIHEEQIQGQSRKIEALETRADYKEDVIKELKDDMKELKKSMDSLDKTINDYIIKSIEDDNNLKSYINSLENRVTALETKIDTQEETIAQYEKKATKQRDNDRAKTNQYLAIITCGIGVLSFIFAYVLR